MTAVFDQHDPAALAAALVAGGFAILQYLGRATVAIHDDLDGPWTADVDERVLWINAHLDPDHYGAAIADGMRALCEGRTVVVGADGRLGLSEEAIPDAQYLPGLPRPEGETPTGPTRPRLRLV